MKNILRLLTAASLAAVVCGLNALAQTPAQSKAQAQAQAQQAKDESVGAYRLGPEDVLTIEVFEVAELHRQVQVSQDGSINLPLLGKVYVEGLTVEGLTKRLTELLQKGFVKNPQVTIFIDQYKSKMASVIGAVTNPGRYPVIGRKSLLQMISEAGGVTDQAGNEILILREGPDGQSRTIPIDYRELSEAGNQDLNIPIEPNDVISIPIDREIKVFVTGRVTRPGTVTAKVSAGITLMQAIADAGGIAQGAKQTAIMIKRVDKNGREIRLKVNLRDIQRGKKQDIRLQEGDVVHVPESFW